MTALEANNSPVSLRAVTFGPWVSLGGQARVRQLDDEEGVSPERNLCLDSFAVSN